MLGAAKDIAIDLRIPAILVAARLVLRHHLLLLPVPDYILWCLQGAADNAVKLHSAAGLDETLLIANKFRFRCCGMWESENQRDLLLMYSLCCKPQINYVDSN